MEHHRFDPTSFGLSTDPEVVVRLSDAAATTSLGHAIGAHSHPGDWVGLIGNLGAGKTTFTQGLAASLGHDGATSPTYTLLNVYRGTTPVFHFDLYRLETVGDLEGVGYWDYVESGEGVSVVEWIDQIPQGWPGQGIVVELLYAGEAREARIWGASPALRAQIGEM